MKYSTFHFLLFAPATVTAVVQNTVGSLTFFNFTQSVETQEINAYSGRAQIVYFDETYNSLRLQPYHRLVVNLMLPPAHTPNLCEYPVSTAQGQEKENGNTTNSFQHNNIEGFPLDFAFSPIALLVPLPRGSGSSNTNTPLDDCDILTKIKVALRIQQEMIKDNLLWTVIFYNAYDNSDGDEYDSSIVYPMEIPPNLTSNDIPGLDNLILASVSHMAGSLLLEQIERTASVGYVWDQDIVDVEMITNDVASPYLLNKDNLAWQLPISLERGPDVPFRFRDPNEDNDDNNDWGTEMVIWFRYVVFALILAVPLVRCLRLWWIGGGRIRFRRDERGYIIGLLYQSPLSDWYSLSNIPAVVMNHGDPEGTQRQEKLTKDEVLALPEIAYKSPDESPYDVEDFDTPTVVRTGNDDLIIENQADTNNADQLDDSKSQLGKKSESSASLCLDARSNQKSKDQNDGGSEPDEEEDEESVVGNTMVQDVPTENIPLLTTISTTCSICIEEFEDGEMVRLLPRCGHGFHTDCILPWLTERQGCCPFCKTNVLESASKEESGDAVQSGEDEENPGTTTI
jgi:hypothetical protein